MEKVMWAASGSEAIQKALWACLKRDPQRDIMIATRYGFHGKKGLANAVTGTEHDSDRDPRVKFIKLDEDAMRGVMDRDAIDPATSIIAFDADQPVGVGMLAIRESVGWIGGMGVVPSHRRRGIGKQIMQGLLANAGQRNLKRVELEVIEANHAAKKLYEMLGFQVTRRLLIVEHHPTDTFQDDNQEIQIEAVTAREALQYYEKFHTMPNPWQRRYEALRHLQDGMGGWLAMRGRQVLAYAVGWANLDMIRLMDVAMRGGAGEALAALLMEIHLQEPVATTSLVNLPADDPVWTVMQAMGYHETNAQYEMFYSI